MTPHGTRQRRSTCTRQNTESRGEGHQTNRGRVHRARSAVLLLIGARLYAHHRGWLTALSEAGVSYWGALYIPVVVAMAAQQNVVAALRGGPVALIAAIGSVLLCGVFVSFINRLEPDTDGPSEHK